MSESTHHVRIQVRAEYDPEKGELIFTEDTVRRVVEVRAKFEEQAFRQAAIIELERLGYLVTPPKEPTP